jgi:hypothetical protein
MAALLVAAAATAVPLTLTTATPAQADRCEPSELVLRTFFPKYEETFMDERDNPVCYVLLNYVYPRICDDFSTLNNCVRSVNPKPFTPITVYPYQPDGGRIYCNLYLTAARTLGQSTTCTYSATNPPGYGD